MLALLLLCCAVGYAQAPNNDKADEVKAMVEQAAALVGEKGREYALRLFNSGSGPFIKGELYIFAGDLEGRNLSHPRNRKLVGQSVLDLKDAKGKLFIRDFIKIAEEHGAGWVDYWWLRHGEKEPSLKRVYVRRIPGEDFYVGCGYYIDQVEARK
jgi:cytochrome c